jgi:hypothetical protein
MESKIIILDLIETIRTEPNYRNTEFIDTDFFSIIQFIHNQI